MFEIKIQNWLYRHFYMNKHVDATMQDLAYPLHGGVKFKTRP